MDSLDDLSPKYSTVLCDLWGCVHDGHALLPGVVERLERWRSEGRRVLFVTNAPRTGHAIQAQLDALKLPAGLHDGIVTAGGTGAAQLLGRPVGFLGTADDRADLEARGLCFVEAGYAELACAGLELERPAAEQYEAELQAWRSADVLLHCLNPDRIVHHMGQMVVCAGALADRYEALGGRVVWYGKPFRAIYDHALEIAGSPALDTVVAVGDGLVTDVLGAARAGIACVFVAGGIHAGEEFPAHFATRHGLGDWRPMLVVPGLR
jgi:HAD superfamily hydrolase (TIGR01459 family)